MPRGMPKRALDRVRKWSAKVTPDYWAFTIRATKDMALEKVAQYHADYEAILRTVKNILSSRYPSEAFRVQEYMWYGLKLYHCIRVYRSKALTRCANAALISFVVLGLNMSALYEIASALGVKPDPLDKIVAGLGVVAGKPHVFNISDGPVAVTDTQPSTIISLREEGIVYVEGVYIDAVNPPGSGVELHILPYIVHSLGRTRLVDEIIVPEGQSFRDWIRWLLDDVPDDTMILGVDVDAYVTGQPQPGNEPTLVVRATGAKLA